IPWNSLMGRPMDITARPGIDGVVSYTYWVGPDGPRTVIPADADGVGHISYTPMAPETEIHVFSTSADGYVSGVASEYIYADPGTPEITSAEYPEYMTGGGPGIPGTFRFVSPLDNVIEYHYSFDYGPEQVVAAVADGSASVVWTPPSASW